MEIVIERDSEILAHHTTETNLSSYGQPVWVVENEDPDPGPATWRQGENTVNMDIIETRGGWLICRQPDGLLCGVIWSDGNYYADVLVDGDGRPISELVLGCYVRNTVQIDSDDPQDLGAIIG